MLSVFQRLQHEDTDDILVCDDIIKHLIIEFEKILHKLINGFVVYKVQTVGPDIEIAVFFIFTMFFYMKTNVIETALSNSEANMESRMSSLFLK